MEYDIFEEMGFDPKFFDLPKNLYQFAIGEMAVKYLETLHPDSIIPLAESKVIELLAEIKAILEDNTLEDPECFCRISAIIAAFETRGVPIKRHDW